jgi:hypothetical protein
MLDSFVIHFLNLKGFEVLVSSCLLQTFGSTIHPFQVLNHLFYFWISDCMDSLLCVFFSRSVFFSGSIFFLMGLFSSSFFSRSVFFFFLLLWVHLLLQVSFPWSNQCFFVESSLQPSMLLKSRRFDVQF